MTSIAPDWLKAPSTVRVMAALAPADPHFVGGCVRDALLGRATADIDIAVRTRPDETMRMAEAAGLSAYPTGVDHGVVTVTAGGEAFEATTLRRDVATDGRRAVIAFADTLEEDAQRRDFTMNALYADASGTVTDPTGQGLPDLTARRIRFIGEDDQRIKEDFLRILRFFRFHAQFAMAEFDDTALAACLCHASGLRQISGERILAEMRKLLAAPDPEPVLAAMGTVLTAAMPGATPFDGLVGTEARIGVEPSGTCRLYALGGHAALPLSRSVQRALDMTERAYVRLGEGMTLAAVAQVCGADAARDAVTLRAWRGAGPPDDWQAEMERGVAATCPVSAQDLMATGIAPGPDLGKRLKKLEAKWLAADLRLSKDDLLDNQS